MDIKKTKSMDKLKSIFKRMGQDTPPFFRKLRIVGVAVAAAGTVIVTTSIALPAVVVTIGGYLIVGGSVATAVSQSAVEEIKAIEEEE